MKAASPPRRSAVAVAVSADVFVYIGDLAPALTATATALRLGGLAAFTVEQADEAGYHLMPTGRYAHAPTFVREVAAAAGLTEVSIDDVVLRVEQGQPVAGLVWVLRNDAPVAGG